ncbi:unnamed protein product [Adineta steineri]|uniref:Uncharacterized protein n=1 Tax=Adineta steineri TaxID=433720 RepID=A0A815WHP5_9BILA|nr:unnamed protein product [Adineta steineri]CAF1545468.1 unnamed protein product [Adineta steineri]
MNSNDRFNCYCYLFWLLFVVVNATTINDFVSNESTKSTLVFFRWSGGFGRNFQEIRCATDQSSEDPSNSLSDVYPEMRDAVYFPPANNDSRRNRCESNSSIFVYNPQTRRVHLTNNRHCIIVNEKSYHYLATEDYPTVNRLKSIACDRAATAAPMNYLIWGSEFRLTRNESNKQKIILQFIAPIDGHEYTIYIRGDILIVVDSNDEARKVLDQLREPTLEIIENTTDQW